jgi:hypothetical protein
LASAANLEAEIASIKQQANFLGLAGYAGRININLNRATG